MLKTVALKEFLTTCGQSKWLSDLYSEDMEVQVNVSQDLGDKVVSSYSGRKIIKYVNTTTGEEWKSFRIPLQANSDPQYEDTDIKFTLANHVESIGMTGWDWKHRKSKWFGYDFDSIVNHKSGLLTEELERIQTLLAEVPWVTLIKSTSGKGLHVYVTLSDDVAIPTMTHTEHAAVARAILSLLSSTVGYKLENSVDICGAILWCWHRKQVGTQGFSMIKQGEPLSGAKVPNNWKDHVAVVNSKQRKVTVRGMDLGALEELINSVRFTQLDETHTAMLKWLAEHAERTWWWDADHNMLVCHTLDLARVHTLLGYKGVFSTSTGGTSDQNCFAFPHPAGSWVVRRHGRGTKESKSWYTDESGWTTCKLNAQLDIGIASKLNQGIENAKGDWVFISGRDLNDALKAALIDVEVPDYLQTDRRTCFIRDKEDKYVISVSKHPSDPPPVGWLSNDKQDTWETTTRRLAARKEFNPPDNLIRHVISNGAELGWYIRTKDQWICQNKTNAVSVLCATSEFNRNDIEQMLGKSILSPWETVNYPFAEEYPGNRSWNKDAASFAIDQVAMAGANGLCDTWHQVLEHCGRSLDDVVKLDPWCRENDIVSGGDYLFNWLACMVKAPTEPLPYLFFYGEQNSGKSTLHEAVGQFLLRRGYSRADRALVDKSGFNGEIANAVLCVVEETNLGQSKEAFNRIKDWVTGRTISIRAMYRNTFDINNTTHWMQCANDGSYCPVFAGDTRIVVLKVDRPTKEIPKAELFTRLGEESASFLRELLETTLPPTHTRLRLPCLSTIDKSEMEFSSQNEVEAFIRTQCKEHAGAVLPFDEFYNHFLSWLPTERQASWSHNKVGRMFPKTGILAKGKQGSKNTTMVANLYLINQLQADGNEYVPPEYKYFYRTNTSTGRLEEVKI